MQQDENDIDTLWFYSLLYDDVMHAAISYKKLFKGYSIKSGKMRKNLLFQQNV